MHSQWSYVFLALTHRYMITWILLEFLLKFMYPNSWKCVEKCVSMTHTEFSTKRVKHFHINEVLWEMVSQLSLFEWHKKPVTLSMKELQPKSLQILFHSDVILFNTILKTIPPHFAKLWACNYQKMKFRRCRIVMKQDFRRFQLESLL